MWSTTKWVVLFMPLVVTGSGGIGRAAGLHCGGLPPDPLGF